MCLPVHVTSFIRGQATAVMLLNPSHDMFLPKTDARFRLTEDLVDSEREFLVSLRTIYDIYARPLRKLCSISDEEQKQLFGGIEPILSVSNMLLTKLEDALAAWDPHETKIGSLFSKQFWNQFDDYFRFFTQAKE
uniref:DH domain-containing protein n=1 Tax=Daphnia galeata TaxID=27404 RepID=A0A8J2RPA4_9CRUS|nr:unnamed protein product [Daphnia galeata]